MESIATKRLKPRQWRQSGFDDSARYYADENNARYAGSHKDPNQAWRHIALQIGHRTPKGFGYWAVDEKDANDFVGCVGLRQSPGWPELELRCWLVPEHQGKGYAAEACLRCRDYAREIIGATSLVSYIDPANAASIQLAR